MPDRPRRRNPVTALMWSGSALSAASTWVLQVGLFIHVLQTSSVSTLAIVELVGTVPSLLALPVAGTLADRLDPRRLAVASMVLQAVFVTGVAFFLTTDLWVVAACYGAQGLSNTVWPPARQQWLYLLTPPAERPAANARIASVGGVTTIVGAGLGGALSAWSPVTAIVVAVVLQILAAAPLLVLARRPFRRGGEEEADGPRGGGERGPGLGRQVLDGIRVVRDLPLARAVVWIGIAWGCIGGAYAVLLSGHVTVDLHAQGGTLGALFAVDGVAVVVGTVVAGRLAARRHLRVYALSYIVQGAAWAGVFVAGTTVGVFAALACMRLASGVIIALDTTILLAGVPAGSRGRVASLHMTTYNAMARVALALFGLLLTVTDVRVLGIASGAASVLIGVTWLARRDRSADATYLRATSPDLQTVP